MKFSKTWLKEFINIELNTDKLVEDLTMAGLEVAGVERAAPNFHGVVVGEILEVNPHPNADKLTICMVNVGSHHGGELHIVCGATNVRPNLKVPVALIGAELPNSFKIKKAKLRGVESSGMMCSAKELGLPETDSGLLELSSDAPIGVDIRSSLELDDEIIDIELTANRGDCLSILGIAREVASINRTDIRLPEIPEFHDSSDVFPVIVKAKDGCPSYCGRIIRGINNNIVTPAWMQKRLGDLAMHPANFIVDVTNYVMLELGQPLHAFDLTKLTKKIEVRYAKQDESIELLDNRKIKLNENTLVIADSEKLLAIAGVMGGIDSGTFLNTQDIFLESAFFLPEKIVEQVRCFKVQTDASYRYERGVDYDLQLQALNRATDLIIKIAGGKPGGVSQEISRGHLPKNPAIILHRHHIKNVLGILLSDKEITDILLSLGMVFVPIATGWQVTIPSWRAFDITLEEDLIEEIARLYGYHHIPEQKIITEMGINNAISNKNDVDRIGVLLEDLGYHEVITYSFIDKKMESLFSGGDNKPLPLVNPVSSEQTLMRSTLWPGLINTVIYNTKRQQHYLRLFEIGLKFFHPLQAKVDDCSHGDNDKESKLNQVLSLAGVTYGDLYPEQWGVQTKRAADFFDLKNDVNCILKLFAAEDDIEYLPKTHNALHPKRCAQIYVRGMPVGFIGGIHPLIKQELELDKKTCLFELDLSILINRSRRTFKQFSVFPKVKRDIAIIVDKEITWSQIKQKIVDISGELLHNVVLFDIYCNENIGLDKRSLAIRLIFQSVDRTLVDTEIETLMDLIILVLKQTFSASLRG